MKSLFIALAFTTFFTTSLFAQKEAMTELTKRFLDTVQTHSFLSKKVNWDSIRPITIEKASKIEDPNNLMPIFNDVIHKLNDSHSSIYFTKYDQGMPSEKSKIENILNKTDEELGVKPKRFDHKLLMDKYAYINIPAVISEHGNYIDTMRMQISFLDFKKPSAWIIDLTENHGGSYLPMIWNLFNLIDKDHTFSMYYANGKEKLQDVTFKNDENNEILKLFFEIFDLKNKPPYKIKQNKVPIIVLTSNLTASSGEVMAALFLGQRNVRVIGLQTAGLTTVNEVFKLNNNFVLNLATSTFKDRKGKIYEIGEPIKPDILLDFDYMKYVNETENLDIELSEKIIIENKHIFINKAIKVLEEGWME